MTASVGARLTPTDGRPVRPKDGALGSTDRIHRLHRAVRLHFHGDGSRDVGAFRTARHLEDSGLRRPEAGRENKRPRRDENIALAAAALPWRSSASSRLWRICLWRSPARGRRLFWSRRESRPGGGGQAGAGSRANRRGADLDPDGRGNPQPLPREHPRQPPGCASPTMRIPAPHSANQPAEPDVHHRFSSHRLRA